MKLSFFISFILSSTWLYAKPTCETILVNSIATSEKCLNALEKMHKQQLKVEVTSSADKAEIKRLLALLEEKNRTIAFLQSKSSVSSKEQNITTVLPHYLNMKNGDVLSRNAYRVVAFFLNVRNEPSGNGDQVAVYQRGDIVQIRDIVLKESGKYYWLKTDKGWIYVTDATDKTIRKELDRILEQKQSGTLNLTSRLVGKPAEGGGRS